MSRPKISIEMEAWCDGLSTRWKIETVRDFIPKVAALEAKLSKMEEALGFYRAEVNALTLPCSSCDREVHYDFGVSSDFWREHVPAKWRTGVLCAPCLDDIAGGIPEDEWEFVYYSGQAGTVAFAPVKALAGGDDE